MRGKGVRAWRPLVGALTLGACCVGLAWAGDSRRSTDRSAQPTGQVSQDQQSVATEPVGRPAEKVTESVGSGRSSKASLHRGDSLEGMTIRRAQPGYSGRGSSGLASGGTVPLGGTCDCDNDCAETGQCNEAICEEDDLNPGNYRCIAIFSEARSECDLDGLFCTYDYCDGVGNCQAAPLVIGGTTPRTPCLHTCVGGTAAGERCFFDGDCPGAGAECRPRIANSAATICDEPTDLCGVSSGGGFLGRCCTGAGAGTCSYTTLAGCGAGRWSRVTDPFDLAECVCPQYSAGMAPIDTSCTVTGGVPSPAGCADFVTGTTRRCNLSRTLCRNATLDCRKACNTGPDAGQGCNVDSDCDQSGGAALCINQNCVNDSELCPGNYSIGDDYTLASGSYMRLEKIRFRGGVDQDEDLLSFEIFDTSTLTCSDGTGLAGCVAVGDSCNAGAGTCVGPLRVAVYGAFSFGESGTDDYTLTIDCDTLCDPSTTPDETADPATNVIPPSGHLVMRAFSVQDGDGDINEFSRGHWARTTATQVGTTDPDRLWLNHTANVSVAAGTGRYIFELIGDLISNPAAACCDPPITEGTPNTCIDVQQWECFKCIGGPWNNQVCRNTNDCGGFAQGVCSDIKWKGKKFDADPAGQLCSSGVCNVGACCNDSSGVCSVTLDTACTGVGFTFLGLGTTCDPNCCQQPVTGGDCCQPLSWCEGDSSANGSCNNGNAGTPCGTGGTCRNCTGADAFQVTVPPFSAGFCDNDPTEACNPVDLFCVECVGGVGACTPALIGQPCGTGVCTAVGNCQVGAVKVTATFSGVTPDTSAPNTFTFDDGDNCVPSVTDPGWYEVIEIDDCAVVTVDLCCTTPTLTPVWVIVTECENGNPSCTGNQRLFWEEGGFGANEFGSATIPNGANVICADGNASAQWTLRAGRYSYGIFAEGTCENSTTECGSNDDCPPGVPCESNSGPYQGHWTVVGCQQAACCHAAGAPGTPGPGGTCSVTDILECEGFPIVQKTEPGLGGDWLGDLTGGAIDDCSASPCALGSCCLAPGVCDDNNGGGENASCGGNPLGVYHGGVRCVDDPCPTCTINNPANCQKGETVLAWASSEYHNLRIADDFIPLTNSIERLCWTYSWSNACEPPAVSAPPDDTWVVAIYPSDPVTGLPLEGSPVYFNSALAVDGTSNNGDTSFLIWTYTAPVGPVAVTPGNCYWLSIQGKGTVVGTSNCFAFWMGNSGVDPTGTFSLPSNAGNNFCLQDGDSNFTVLDIDHSDFNWCIDSGVQSQTVPGEDGGCGEVEFACCRPGAAGTGVNPTCIDTVGTPGLTVADCMRVHRGIVCPGKTCSTASCDASSPTNNLCTVPPLAAAVPTNPPNDDCAAATPIGGGDCVAVTGNLGRCAGDTTKFCTVSPDDCPAGIGPCTAHGGTAQTCGLLSGGSGQPRYTIVDNRLANRDGLANESGITSGKDCSLQTPTSVQADVWYKFTAPCTGQAEFRTCPSSTWFDGRVTIHNGGSNCGNCASLSGTTRLKCQDDGCADFFDGQVIFGADRGFWDVTANTCYLIRYGGFATSSGTINGDTMLPAYGIAEMEINVLCSGGIGPNPPTAIATYPHGARKQRYISFAPEAGHTLHAYQVRDVGSGLTKYISTPRTTPTPNNLAFIVNDASPITFNWTSTPQVHVGGCMIAPGTDSGPAGVGREYRVRATADGTNFSSELTLFTAARPTAANARFWADIVGLFAAGGDGTTTPPTPVNSWTPSNRVVAGFDISAALQGAASAATRPHLTWGDINPELTDRVTNGPDTLRVVNAFGVGTGKEFYPFAYPVTPSAIHHPTTPPSPALCPTPPLQSALNP